MVWFTYVVECRDGSLYCGVTTSLERRIHEHNATSRGARYTRTRRPVHLVASWPQETRSLACIHESWFKSLDRPEKIAVIRALAT